jgi:phosphotriesterase-related protein
LLLIFDERKVDMTEPTVMTVRGPVAASELGPVLPHEHVFIDLNLYVEELGRFKELPIVDDPVDLSTLKTVRNDPYSNRDNCVLDDPELMIEELMEFKNAGGGTVVDLTNADLGPQPEKLKLVSERTGLNIVLGNGHYVSFGQPPELASWDIQTIENRLVDEIENGFGDTGIRPGIIGEIGTTMPIHPDEEKVLRAAARAHHRTGLTITVHVHPPTRGGFEVLDILAQEEVDLTRVVLGHVDTALAHDDIDITEAIEYHKQLAERGPYIEYDLCGNSNLFSDGAHSWWFPSDRERCKGLAALIEAGFGEQLLISQDVGHKFYLSSFGGWGFAHVLTLFKGMMERAGISEEWHNRITHDNPRRMLTGVAAD